MDQYKYEFTVFQPDIQQKKHYTSKEMDIINILQAQIKVSLQHLNPDKLQKIHFKKKPKLDLQNAVIALHIIFCQNVIIAYVIFVKFDAKWTNIKKETDQFYLKLLSYPDFFKDRYRIFIEKAKKVLYENDPMISPNDENFIIIKPNSEVEMTSYNAVITFASCFISLYEIIININSKVVYEEQEELYNERLQTEQSSELSVITDKQQLRPSLMVQPQTIAKPKHSGMGSFLEVSERLVNSPNVLKSAEKNNKIVKSDRIVKSPNVMKSAKVVMKAKLVKKQYVKRTLGNSIVRPDYLRTFRGQQDEEQLQNQRIGKLQQEISLLVQEIKQIEQKIATMELSEWELIREQKKLGSKKRKLEQKDEMMRYELWHKIQFVSEKQRSSVEKKYHEERRQFRTEVSQEKQPRGFSYSEAESLSKSQSKSKSPSQSKSPSNLKSQEEKKLKELARQEERSRAELARINLMRQKFESLNDKL